MPVKRLVRGCAVAGLAAWTVLGCSAGGGSKSAASGDPLPTYEEGGTLELRMNNVPVSVPITDALFNNTDEGYPDYVELSGPQTYLRAICENKIHDGSDGLSDFKPILHQGLPVKGMEASDPLKIHLPGMGEYPVTGGTFTLTKYDHGMDGRVMWEGNIALVLDTANGPVRAPGTFKFGIVPVW